MDELSQQEQRVKDSLEAFRRELTAYKKLAKAPPLFLRDGIPAPLRADMLKDARVFPDRFDLVRTLVSGGVGAEVGVQAGVFSRFLLDEVKPEKLYLFDLGVNRIARDVLDDPRTEMLQGDSSTRLQEAEDKSLDWVYIDGDHSLIGTQKDADVARQKVKPGGLLIFNDYIPWSLGEAIPYGVMTVVNSLVNEGYPVEAIALAKHGYFDIAVRYQKKH